MPQGRSIEAYHTGSDGVRVWYRHVPGSGVPVLFLHGIGSSVSASREIADLLVQAGRSVLVPDLRGHGLSDRPTSPDDYLPERFIDDIIGVMDDAGVARVHVLGHCFGAMLGMRLAERSPERVATLTLVGPGLGGAADWRVHVLALPLMRFGRWWYDAFDPAGAQPPRRHVDYARYRGRGDWYLPRIWGDYRTMSPASAEAFSKAFARSDFSGSLPGITAPTLVVHAALDTVYSGEVARRIAGSIPGARYVVLPGVNHEDPVWHDPTDLMALVCDLAFGEPSACGAAQGATLVQPA